MAQLLNIRTERQSDQKMVEQVVQRAFTGAVHSDGHEHDLVAALRNDLAFLPELSLVAEKDGQVVGYALFTEVQIGGHVALALAPLAVHPVHQAKGIGAALMHAGHERAKALGYVCVVVLGDPLYYGPHGYLPADEFGIIAPFDVPPAYFMVKMLQPEIPALRGAVRYALAFGLS